MQTLNVFVYKKKIKTKLYLDGVNICFGPEMAGLLESFLS